MDTVVGDLASAELSQIHEIYLLLQKTDKENQCVKIDLDNLENVVKDKYKSVGQTEKRLKELISDVS